MWEDLDNQLWNVRMLHTSQSIQEYILNGSEIKMQKKKMVRINHEWIFYNLSIGGGFPTMHLNRDVVKYIWLQNF